MVKEGALVREQAAPGIESLRWRARRHVEKHTNEDDEIRFALRGTNGQALVALQDRLIIIKPGITAGALGGARVTTFYYDDITGIEANTGLMMGVIEVNTPAFPGTTTKDYWSQDKDRNPRFLSNCVPIDRAGAKAYKPYLDQLRNWIREAKQGTRGGQGSAPATPSMADELQKLASLKESGVLTEEEFQQAKRRLIGEQG
jgi:hypothetical protein